MGHNYIIPDNNIDNGSGKTGSQWNEWATKKGDAMTSAYEEYRKIKASGKVKELREFVEHYNRKGYNFDGQ